MELAELYEKYIEETARRHRAEVFWLKGESFRPWDQLSEHQRFADCDEARDVIEGRYTWPQHTVNQHTV